jgi:signal transduction histidine kinase
MTSNHKIKIDLLIHDLKNPLAVIETGIRCLLEREDKYGEISDKQRKVLNRVLKNTRITKTRINDALELARSEAGVFCMNSFNLFDLIKDVSAELFDLIIPEHSESVSNCGDSAQLCQALTQAGFFLSIPDALWDLTVCLDQKKLKQLLRNLLDNAFKYRKKRVELRVEKMGEKLVFSVKDDGEGIPPSLHQKIFDSYFQLEDTDRFCVRGHGLGLAGVAVLVEDMGGKMSLESREGEGANFSVAFPIHE